MEPTAMVAALARKRTCNVQNVALHLPLIITFYIWINSHSKASLISHLVVVEERVAEVVAKVVEEVEDRIGKVHIQLKQVAMHLPTLTTPTATLTVMTARMIVNLLPI